MSALYPNTRIPTTELDATRPVAEDAPPRGAIAARQIAELLAAGARILAPILTAFSFVAVAANAGLAVARLFARLGADEPAQALAAIASVGVLVALIGILTLSANSNLRALAVLYAVGWLPLVLALVGFEAALASDLVAVPPALSESGRIVAGLLAGIAALPVTTLIIATRRADPGDVRAALGYYVSNALKLVLLVATVAANLSFGLRRGVPLEVSVFVATILETAFVLAMLRANTHALHAAALVVFGAAISLVAVETLGTLSGLADLSDLAAIGKAFYLLSPALAIAYIVAALLISRPRGAVRPFRRAASIARDWRSDLAELRAALSERDASPALPAERRQAEHEVVVEKEVVGAPSSNGAHPKSRF